MKTWMTYLNALRPAASRHWGAGPDHDHHRMATELSYMSQAETSTTPAHRAERADRRAARSKSALIAAAEPQQEYIAPYPQSMGDRFRPVLSTR